MIHKPVFRYAKEGKTYNFDKIFTKNNITYTMLSYTCMTNGLVSPNDYYVNEVKVKSEIEALRDKVDVLMVAMHWGDEYKSLPNDTQKQIAHYLASLKVDIIIGTHPHVIDPIEWIDKTLVIYSLGNFVSSQNKLSDYNKLIGLDAHVDIVKTDIDGDASIKLTNLNTDLIYTYFKNYTNFEVIPFSIINDAYLKDYTYYKDKYNKIIKTYDKNIVTN